LLAAANKAVTVVQTKTGKRLGLGWGPVLDGKFFPKAPGEVGAEALALDVPLMIGTTKTEFGMSARNPEIFSGSKETVKKELEKKYGDKTDAYILAFEKAYPNTRMPSDMLDVDFLFRPGTLAFANIRSNAKGAKVYNYLFAWDSPVLDGMLKSSHCMELGFVFNNIARTEQYNGGTPEAYALAEKMAKTWISFARTGDPGNSSIPQWEPYTEANGSTMIFDNTIELKHNHDKALFDVAGAMKNNIF
jgi:para-nitrobenzyl esterase